MLKRNWTSEDNFKYKDGFYYCAVNNLLLVSGCLHSVLPEKHPLLGSDQLIWPFKFPRLKGFAL